MITKLELKNKLLVILGPTATSKTDLALFLAKRFNGELVSCDSRQVYKGLDIGTGKLPSLKLKVKSSILKKRDGFWEINGIKVWMYDVVSPEVQYTVYNYVKDANKVIKDIRKRGKLPIIVGGTGLYLKALLEELPNLSIPVDEQLRKNLERLTREQLQERLKKVSFQRWEKLNTSDKENPRRLIRAIELVLNQKLNIKDQNEKSIIQNVDKLKIGLTAPREILYKKVDERVIKRINQGMIDEAKTLHNKELTFKRMRQLGLEYGVLADYLENKIKTKENLIKIMQGKIHGYLRRQLTWFKKEKNVNWFDITTSDYQGKIEKLVSRWYDSARTYATKNRYFT